MMTMKTCSVEEGCYTEEMTFDDGDGTIISQGDKVLCEHTYNTADPHHPHPTKTRSNTVRFDTSMKIYSIPSHTDYTQKERSRCWYTQKEKKLRERKLAKIVSRIENDDMEQQRNLRPHLRQPASSSSSSSSRHSRFCYRGLENLTKEGGTYVTSKVQMMINSVMDEQDMQWMAGADEPLRIARISQAVSAECVSLALLVAQSDEEEAIKLYSKNQTKVFYQDEIVMRCLSRLVLATKRAPDIFSKKAI